MHHPPRALRVGIISDKRVILERLLPPGQPAELGSDPRCALRVPGQPRALRLLSYRQGSYYLHIQPGMAGVIARGGQRVALPSSGQVAIREGDRGKVSLGELTLLLQLVPAPPEMLGRKGFRRELVEPEDAVFAGFLSLTSAIATVLVALVQLTPPALITSIEDHDPRIVSGVLQMPRPEPAPVIVRTPAPPETPRPPPLEVPRPPDPLANAALRAEQLAESQGDRIGRAGMLSVLRTRGPSVFDPGGDEALRDALARMPNEPTGGASPALLPSAREGRGEGIGGATIGDLTIEGPGGSARVADPTGGVAPREDRTGTVRAPPPEKVPSGLVDVIREAVRRQAPQVRACYERRLKEIPTLSGKLAVAVEVEGDRVSAAAVVTNGTGDEALASCVEKAVIRWRFAGVGDATFELPFVLAPGE